MAISRCGYITHVKGEKKVKGHNGGFTEAVEFAKKQSKPTGVLSVCGGKVKRVAVCANGGCGGGLAGVRRKRTKVRKRRRARRQARRG